MSTYKVKIIKNNGAFAATVEQYRKAVDFLIDVVLTEWEYIFQIKSPFDKLRAVEKLTHKTTNNLSPNYLRRASIQEAIGKVSSYKSNYANWEKKQKGNAPGLPKAGKIFPAMYRDNCFVRTGANTAELKVFINRTWDWLNIELKNTDVKYIQKHCKNRKECVPTLQKRGKNWYLDFAFEEEVKIEPKEINQQIILGVDLGINNECVCSAMKSDGTVIGRKF